MDDRLFDVWAGADAAPGFADRVLAALETPPAARPRRWWIAAAAIAAVATAAVLWWPRGSDALEPGALAASERRTVALGDRAIAVAEPGATLAWLDDGGARVEQSTGDVFYRVDRGPLRVVTPTGTISVTGTCFRVEVSPMKRELIAGGVGAAVAAIVTVVVYEGAVVARNDDGEVTAGAGESIVLAPGAAPDKREARIAAAPADASRELLLVRDRELVQRLTRLQTRVDTLEAELARAGGGDELEPGQPADDEFLDFTDDELAWMAKQCELRYDVPGWALSLDASDHLGRALATVDIPDAEKEIITKAVAAGNAAFIEQLRALYIEVTGDRAGAEAMSPRNLQHEVFDKANQADLREAYRRISAERAGLAEPPADVASRPAVERMLRLLMESGAMLEHTLASQLGAERAHEIREQGLAWGRRRQGGCPE